MKSRFTTKLAVMLTGVVSVVGIYCLRGLPGQIQTSRVNTQALQRTETQERHIFSFELGLNRKDFSVLTACIRKVRRQINVNGWREDNCCRMIYTCFTAHSWSIIRVISQSLQSAFLHHYLITALTLPQGMIRRPYSCGELK